MSDSKSKQRFRTAIVDANHFVVAVAMQAIVVLANVVQAIVVVSNVVVIDKTQRRILFYCYIVLLQMQ